MSEKRFEYGEGTEGPLIYDNDGVDDYYFLNKPKEMEDFIKLLNSNEEYWQEKYDVLLNRYNKQLKLNLEQDREIRQLKKELVEMKDKAYEYGCNWMYEYVSSRKDEEQEKDKLRKEIYGEKAEQKRLQELKKEIEEKRICKNIPIEERIISVWKMPLK